ncbi:MAG: VanZ family protein [Paludibacteraceae bacterium]|nr:VanZ family protein [Paludibacteraceae bacterium]
MKRHFIALLTAIVILVLSTMPVGSFLPEVEVPNIDKPVHFLMYAFFTVAILLDRVFLQRRPIALWYIFAPLIAIAYGGAMEIVQHFLPWRSCSIYDFIANDIGAIIGTLVFALFYKLFHKI